MKCYLRERIHEQLETGTIKRDEPDGYTITEAGKKLMGIYDMTVKIYGLEDKLGHPGG